MNKVKAHTVWGILALICMLMAVLSGFMITSKHKKPAIPDSVEE